MVEVFKTNVEDPRDAIILIDRIQKTFIDYKANFDLEDCDKILRIKSNAALVQSILIINLLRRMGFEAKILPDEKPSMLQIMLFDKKHYPVF